MFSYVNLNDPLNAKKIMSCKIKPVWAIWYMAFYGNPECDSQEWGRIYKINNVSAAAYPGLRHGTFQPMARYANYVICIFKNTNAIV